MYDKETIANYLSLIVRCIHKNLFAQELMETLKKRYWKSTTQADIIAEADFAKFTESQQEAQNSLVPGGPEAKRRSVRPSRRGKTQKFTRSPVSSLKLRKRQNATDC